MCRSRFCIKMPILHRLACFRDDVVFLVFLYQVRTRPPRPPTGQYLTILVPILQRWIYRIDPKRVNEYGQVMVEGADAVAEAKGKGATETKKNK